MMTLGMWLVGPLATNKLDAIANSGLTHLEQNKIMLVTNKDTSLHRIDYTDQALSSRYLRDDPLIDVVPGAFIRLTDKMHFTGDICVMGICEGDEICKREIKAAFIC